MCLSLSRDGNGGRLSNLLVAGSKWHPRAEMKLFVSGCFWNPWVVLVIRWDALPKFVCKSFCRLPLHQLTFVSHGTQQLRGMCNLQVLITEFPLTCTAQNIFCVFLVTPWEQSANKAVRTRGRDIFPQVYWFRSWHNKVFKPNLIITCY